MEEFSQYKMLIMSEINTLKNDFAKFKEQAETSLTDIKVTLAVLTSKLLMITAVGATIASAIVSFMMDKLLK